MLFGSVLGVVKVRDFLVCELRRGLRSTTYWCFAFASFFVVFFLPAGVGAVRSVFYLLIVIPAFFCMDKKLLRALFKSSVFGFLLLLSLLSLLLLSGDEKALDVLKFVLSSACVVVGATHLGRWREEKVRHYSFFVLAGLVFYVLLNVAFAYFRGEWLPGRRIPILYGQAKSVIFTADLVVGVLVFYSWLSIKSERWIAVVLANVATLLVIMFFLQSRSALAVWFAATAAMLFLAGGRIFFRVGVALVLSIGLVFWGLAVSGVGSDLIARADSYRVEIWRGYVDAAVSCGWLLGCGWGAELRFVTHNGLPISHPHSMYVQHFYWAGSVGLFLLLACLGSALYESWKRSSPLFWLLLPGCVALSLDGKALVSAPNERWLLVLLPLLFIAAEQVSRSIESADGSLFSFDTIRKKS